MFIDRISVSVITLNLIPLHVPVFPGFYADIVVLVKTIVDTYWSKRLSIPTRQMLSAE